MAGKVWAVVGFLFFANGAAAQFAQPGIKLVGTGGVASPGQGASVAISADGSTAIVGGPSDNLGVGAAWVFTRVGGAWTQQGGKLVGSGAVGQASQGQAVAISADGNTAIVGGSADNSSVGAAWVFTRTGAVWTQQGGKLVGSGAVGAALQGFSVAISGDGSTAVIGGVRDNNPVGAAWVFTRSGGVWTQQGTKLTGSDATSQALQGWSVAISGDGNTAIVGGYADASFVGASWVFRRSGGVWTQQGSKLVGAGSVSDDDQGTSVGLSADGNTAIVGKPGASDYTGAGLVFTRSGGVWSQEGGDLVGAGSVGEANQGNAVAISGDGNTVILGGHYDNSNAGAAWVFTRIGGAWSPLGSKLSGTDASASFGASAALSADGTTAIIGAPYTGSGAGAAWVFSFSPSHVVWVPVASHNGGKNNSQWRSDLGLLDTGAVTANVQIKFFGSGAQVSSTTYVPAGTQSILTDVVGQLGGSNSGALEILSDQALRVTARTYNQVSSTASCYANGTQGQNYPAVVAGDGLAATQSAYLAGLTENASYHCNIGLVDTGTGAATVLVELFSGSGSKLTDYTVTLNPGDWKQETQPFLNKAGQHAMDRGYAKVTVQAGSGVFAFGSVIDNITNDPTTVTMQR